VTIGPLRSAISALAVASLLFGAMALCHDDEPVARLMAERTATERDMPGLAPSTAPSPDRIPTLAAASATLNSPSSGRGRETTEPGTHSAEHLTARSGNSSARFLNASQSHRPAERGPAIQLGPPQTNGESGDAEASTSKSTAETGLFVTRTYRPVSMSAVSLERLVRPLLTGHGAVVASNGTASNGTVSDGTLPVANDRGPATDATRAGIAESAGQPDVLVVSDRPEAIGRIDALCRDLESMSPRIAIDLVVVSVVPTSGEQLPWEQWRNSFGTVESDLPCVLRQIRGLGRATVCTRSQLQCLGGTWTELAWSEQSVAGSPHPDAAALDEEDREPSTSPSNNTAGATALTTLHVRPRIQPDGTIRLEVRAQSGRLENRGQPQRPQLVSIRFNTEVVLHEGATGVVNLFVDEPGTTAASSPSATATLVIPSGTLLPAAKIVPQPGQREQTLLLLMPRIVRPARPGKIAVSQPRNPA
jgi:hypothetical protein